MKRQLKLRMGALLASCAVPLGLFGSGTAGAQDLESRVQVQAPAAPAEPAEVPTVSTIEQALALTYGDNPRLLGERALLRGSDARLAQARSQYGPSLSMGASYGFAYDRYDNLLGPDQVQDGFSGTVRAILNQPLYASGRLRAGVQLAEADIAAGRQSLRLVESQTLLGVFTAFINVGRDRSLVEIVQQNRDLLLRQLAQSETRLRVQEITRTDRDQVQTRLAVGVATAESTRASLSISEAQFLRFVGARPAEALVALPPTPPGMPASLEEAHAIAERESPLLLLAHARERLSRAQVRQAEADRGPTVGLEASASYGGIQPYSNNLNQRNLRGSVVIDLPVFDSGLRAARIREARELNEADWRLIDDALREVRAQLELNWDQWISARQAATQLATAVVAAQNAYEGAVLQERAGARTTFEVLDLLRDLLDVRSQLVNAKAQAQLAQYGLLAAMGRLEGPLLLDDIQPYTPAANLAAVSASSDIPLITATVESLDSITAQENESPRPYRDPAAGIRSSGLPLATSPAVPVPAREE
jgi:TolC family type I secretion outer membrane protein